ncbi:hypothetical protein M9458_010857, partial [Cirrhinus mrigala]
MVVDNPGSCEHCARFTMKSLRRRLARQASLSGLDPLLSPSPTPAATPKVPIPVELPTTAALSWGEQLDACVPLPNVLSTDEEEDALDFEEEGQSDFLLSEEEEDFEDSPFLPPEHSAQPLAVAGSIEDVDGAPSLLLSVDLQDVCKRVAEKLSIPWPTVVAETAETTETHSGCKPLPSKADRYQSNMTERAYKAVALCVRALNATSLLTA